MESVSADPTAGKSLDVVSSPCSWLDGSNKRMSEWKGYRFGLRVSVYTDSITLSNARAKRGASVDVSYFIMISCRG